MSNLSASPTRREKVEVRERAILSAAREVFVEYGYEGARMAEIARRAGIAEGTVYIYYKTKVDLMKSIVADFWNDLTIGARAATRGHKDIYQALRALADFHMTALIERFDVIELTQSLRTARPDASSTRQDMRTYVAVFDDLFQRGIDRGVFGDATPVWIARDLFYGTLEYSARTILLRDEDRPTGVVDNIVEVFRARFEVSQTSQAEIPSNITLTRRLENAIERLEALSETQT